MGALTSHAAQSVATLTEEEIIRRVVAALAEVCPPFPAGPGGDCAIFSSTGGRLYRVSTVDTRSCLGGTSIFPAAVCAPELN